MHREYERPSKTKGKWQSAPLAFPWRVFTTVWQRSGSAAGLEGAQLAPHNLPGPALTYASSQRPELILIKVGITLNALARGKGMGQEPILAVEGVPIPMLCGDKNT